MAERFSPKQVEKMIQTSKRFEQVWRVYSRWQEYSNEEVEKQKKFLLDNADNVCAMAEFDEESAEIYERISMGIYHHPEIQEPPELEYKIHLN